MASVPDTALRLTRFRGAGDSRPVRFPFDHSTDIALIPMAPEALAQRLAAVLAGKTDTRSNTAACRPVPPVTVAFMNMRNFMALRRRPDSVAAFTALDQVYPDGVGLQIARRLVGLAPFPRVSGTETLPLLLAAAPAGTRVFLLGSDPRSSRDLMHRFPDRFPDVQLVGTHHGYLASDEDNRDVLDLIRATRPDLLLIGMGSPRQEQWLARHRYTLPVRLAVCVGGLFQYWSGDLFRAPRWMRALGLEWAWILAQQPEKWRVYTVDAVAFAAILLRLKAIIPR